MLWQFHSCVQQSTFSKFLGDSVWHKILRNTKRQCKWFSSLNTERTDLESLIEQRCLDPEIDFEAWEGHTSWELLFLWTLCSIGWTDCPQSQGIPAIVWAVEFSEVKILMGRSSSFHQGLKLEFGCLQKTRVMQSVYSYWGKCWSMRR